VGISGTRRQKGEADVGNEPDQSNYLTSSYWDPLVPLTRYNEAYVKLLVTGGGNGD